MMFFYNQNNYGNVDYSKPDGSYATVKSGGCGVCSALMVLNNLYGREVMTVAQMAKFSQNCGARIMDGTNMTTLMNALCDKYDIKYKATIYDKELLQCLKEGGMAVINQGDDYEVFSSAGHFVAGYKLASADTVIVLDPDLRDGKYQRSPKCERIVKQVGNEIYAKIGQIGLATQDRNPCYFLVTFTGKRNKPSMKAGQTVKLTKRAKLYNGNSAATGVRKIRDFSKFDCSAEAIIKAGAKFQVDKVLTKPNGNIWAYNAQYNGWICVYDYQNDVSKV